jgi:peptidoglycan lytic transglycosylase G
VSGSLDGDYLVATRSSPALDPARYGASAAGTLEGFLFPATYEVKRGRDVSVLVSQQLAAFRREFPRVDLRYARGKNLTAYDVLTIASMVEREAKVANERPLIASVIYNRLRRDMPLGIDATIRFATGNWEKPLTRSQLATDSPYNTRKRAGLPPGPIGSPGLASIGAAAAPARTDFLFYVVKPCAEGGHDFSKTEAEFQRDVDRYNRERERRGGRSPTKC